jgi:hypothetical protein
MPNDGRYQKLSAYRHTGCLEVKMKYVSYGSKIFSSFA